MRKIIVALAVTALLAACGTTTRPGVTGVNRQQFLVVPAETVERMALVQYAGEANKAKAAGRLIESGPEYERLKRIGARLIRQTVIFRDDVKQWKWQLVLIDAPTINASCSPGGKVTFYTGIVRSLDLSDDEIAVVMGHEIAHAVREHGREQVSEAMGQKLLISLAAAKSPEQTAAIANEVGRVIFLLPHSRERESEADKIGLELMARAGFNPSAAVTFWRKMARATGSAPLQFVSTHPSNATRINELTSLQPLVQPLYAAAKQ